AIEQLGSNLLSIRGESDRRRGAAAGGGGAALTYRDVQAIRDEVPGLSAVDGSVSGGVQVISATGNWFTQLEGVTPDHFIARNWKIAEGRLLEEADLRAARKVAVVGQTVARSLFGEADPIGQRIRLNRTPFEIVGVTAEKGQSPFGTDQDDVIFAPLTSAQRSVLGRTSGRTDQIRRITVSVADDDAIDAAQAAIEEVLRRAHRIRPGDPDDFSVRNLAAIVESRAEATRTFTILLASVAAVSLLVGGIGIMNIMLVSVTERTREIGLRMALGARRGDILAQFALEAVTLSLAGGAIGLALGVAGALVVSDIGQWDPVISPGSLVMSFGFAALVGLVFGAYPARRAARLDPIEALRRE
ncbi:MAG: ABC transporter permease, partial [Caulobacterales bacterium]|nr:ABC transporter permease [Caulobacterales bacterium]